ncbi:MAG: hypothetical protein ACI8S6_000524 [Myxococcota bacterium]|jgi:hypothetical protein
MRFKPRHAGWHQDEAVPVVISTLRRSPLHPIKGRGVGLPGVGSSGVDSPGVVATRGTSGGHCERQQQQQKKVSIHEDFLGFFVFGAASLL